MRLIDITRCRTATCKRGAIAPPQCGRICGCSVPQRLQQILIHLFRFSRDLTIDPAPVDAQDSSGFGDIAARLLQRSLD